MITLGFDHFFVVCTMLSAIALIIAWARFVRRDAVAGWNLSQEELCQCRKCGVVFVLKRTERVARCPECGELVRAPAKKSARRVSF